MATEKRLIKLQKRLKFAGDVFEALMKNGWSCTEAMDFVNSFQDADAVEVVRCKDCKYFDSIDGFSGYVCRKHCGLPIVTKETFCSFGERKDK